MTTDVNVLILNNLELILTFVFLLKTNEIWLCFGPNYGPRDILPICNELVNCFKAKGRPRKRWREDIKYTMQQHDLTVSYLTRQARAIILKLPPHRRGREQQPCQVW
jgi:hypothetical protein